MGQIIDLLLAAGYFRVRIKGLSSFDKVSLISLLFSLVRSVISVGCQLHIMQHFAENV